MQDLNITPTKEEKRFWENINNRRRKAGFMSVGYSYNRDDPSCGTLFPGRKVAICKKACGKQILKKYGLVNDTPAEQERLRNLIKRGQYVCG